MRTCSDKFRQFSATLVVPQIRLSTEFRDDVEAVLSGFFGLLKGIFRTPSTWTSSARLVRSFWGALDGQQLLVVEGWEVTGTQGV